LQAVLAHPARYTIQGSDYLLVELSNYSVPKQVTDCFLKLVGKGLTPLITHPERNPILQRTPERVLEWVEQGCGVQVTASALTGEWGDKVKSVAKWLLEQEAVHALASDAHDLNHRVPKLSEGRDAVAEICGAEIAQALVEDNPRAVVSGEPLAYFPRVQG
jgi:protein-tyrosine phosphatase